MTIGLKTILGHTGPNAVVTVWRYGKDNPSIYTYRVPRGVTSKESHRWGALMYAAHVLGVGDALVLTGTGPGTRSFMYHFIRRRA